MIGNPAEILTRDKSKRELLVVSAGIGIAIAVENPVHEKNPTAMRNCFRIFPFTSFALDTSSRVSLKQYRLHIQWINHYGV